MNERLEINKQLKWSKILSILFISYLIGFSTLLILYPNYRPSKINSFNVITFLIFCLTAISIIIFIVLSIINILKKRIHMGILCVFIGITDYALYQKIAFEDYNVFLHSSFLLITIWFYFKYKNQITRSKLLTILIVVNSVILVFPNLFILSYWNSNKIIWKESGLEWDDYQDSVSNHLQENYYDSEGEKINHEQIHAVTSNAIKYKINRSGNIPSVIIGAYFVKDESYVIDEFKTKSELIHQEIYVDICELYVRLIRREFEYKTIGMVDYKVLFDKYKIDRKVYEFDDYENAKTFIEEMIHRKESMNEEYMFETDFGKNLKAQKKWNLKIKTLLNELDEYR